MNYAGRETANSRLRFMSHPPRDSLRAGFAGAGLRGHGELAPLAINVRP